MNNKESSTWIHLLSRDVNALLVHSVCLQNHFYCWSWILWVFIAASSQQTTCQHPAKLKCLQTSLEKSTRPWQQCYNVKKRGRAASKVQVSSTCKSTLCLSYPRIKLKSDNMLPKVAMQQLLKIQVVHFDDLGLTCQIRSCEKLYP